MDMQVKYFTRKSSLASEIDIGASFRQHYIGLASQELIEAFLNMLSESTVVGLPHAPARKRLLLVLIECMQNAVKYGMQTTDPYPEISYELVIDTNGTSHIRMGNYVSGEQVEHLQNLLGKLETMGEQKLKELFISLSRDKVKTIDSSPSSGLGWIEIIRCSKNGIRYGFEQISDNCFWFTYQVEVA